MPLLVANMSFLCLEALNIEFSYTYDVISKGLNLTSPEESDDEVRNAEENEAWRALMAKTYQALAKNREKYPKSSTLRDIIFKRVSTFADEGFHDFLKNIETFGLSLRGE